MHRFLEPFMEAKRTGFTRDTCDCGGCQACGTCHIHVDDVWCDKLKIEKTL